MEHHAPYFYFERLVFNSARGKRFMDEETGWNHYPLLKHYRSVFEKTIAPFEFDDRWEREDQSDDHDDHWDEHDDHWDEHDNHWDDHDDHWNDHDDHWGDDKDHWDDHDDHHGDRFDFWAELMKDNQVCFSFVTI